MKRFVCYVCWIVAFGCLLWTSQAQAALSDCIDATCRITASDGGRGTGCCFERSQGYVYVLTNAHVATGSVVECEFWRAGHQSRPIAGRVFARSTEIDAAIVVLDESAFGGLFPSVVPMALRGDDPRPGDTITSAGCANGAWATGFQGRVLGYHGGDMRFLPVPANGRSGSAIFNADGTRIVGLLYGRLKDDTEGLAVSAAMLHQVFGRSANGQPSQCGPGGCLPYGGKLMPWRKQQPAAPTAPSNPWPTGPPVTVTPPATVDLTPIGQRLDGIAEILVEIRAEKTADSMAVDDRRLNPLIVAAVVLGGVVVGFVIFFSQQNQGE